MAGRLVSGSEIAGLASSFRGRLPYVFGGIPAQGRVDCSSFVNMVIGWKLGLAIPGFRAGSYRGQSHGPPVISWATWRGGSRKVAEPGPGDLVIWAGLGPLGHIGICTGPGRMVSALNPSEGIKVTPIQGTGPRGAPLSYRRIKSNISSGAFPVGAGGSTAACTSAAAGAGMTFTAWLITTMVITGATLVSACLWRRWSDRRVRRRIAAAALAMVDTGRGPGAATSPQRSTDRSPRVGTRARTLGASHG